MTATQLYDVPAPAKLNLFLHVVGRRADGYHLLQTVFRFIDLCDTLSFDRRSDGKIVRERPSLAGLAAADDLIVKAALLLQKATGCTYGAQIECIKAIPAGGGLGGGSSDAATTLMALNRLWGTGLSRAELMQLGLQLGADVPVFIFGANAFAQGVGEQLHELDLPPSYYNVLQPDVFVSTADIFSDEGLTRNTPSVIITDFTRWLKDRTALACSQKNNVLESLPLFGNNDLESIVCKKYKSVSEVISGLQGLDLHARMTGSGSCVFVEHSHYENAVVQHERIRSKMLQASSEARKLVAGHWLVAGLDDHPLRNWLS